MIYTLTLNPAVDRELTIANFSFNRVLRALSWQVDFGGKGFNVSRMLKILEVESIALGFVGGKSGEMLQQGLASLGIETDFVQVDGETRTNVSIRSSRESRYLKVNEPGPAISEHAQDALRQRVQSRARPGDIWVLAGSLPPGIAEPYYAGLVTMIQERGARVILDTSGQALGFGCRAGAYLVKPNESEAAQLTGRPVDDLQSALRAGRDLRQMGAENVVVSMGKRGAALVSAGGPCFAASPEISEGNPIGAGDSLVAGLASGIYQGYELPVALRLGVACGAATASSPGTQMGSRELVESLSNQVTLQEAL